MQSTQAPLSDETAEGRRHIALTRSSAVTVEALGIGLWQRTEGSPHAEWNTQMFRILGRDPAMGPLDATEWIETVTHPDDRESTSQKMREWYEGTAASFHLEHRIVRSDGQVRWVLLNKQRDAHPSHRATFGFVLDITEKRQTQLALRRANDRVALAASAAGLGIWDADLNMKEVFWNDEMFRMRGLSPAGPPLDFDTRFGLIHPEDQDRVRNLLLTSQRTHEPCAYEFRAMRPDGGWVWLASQSVVEIDEHGVCVRQIGINWNVTEARLARELLQKKELAERESRAKSEFLARMSHELRTPLNAMLGFTQLLQTQEQTRAHGDPATLDKLDCMRRAGEHLLALIDDVLDMSCVGSDHIDLQIEPVPLSTLAADTLSMVESLARERRVHLKLGPCAGAALADRRRLNQVLINLLSNAIKYNRNDGTVTLDTFVAGDRAVVRVADTGAGLSRQQCEHLFEPFNRLGADRSGIEGTGIGLALSKVLVECMGGNIAVASQEGVGSSFEVTLPRDTAYAEPDPLAARPVASPPPAPLEGDGRVLYIEDNEVNALLVRELIRQHTRLGIECAGTGQEGIERALATHPDLILMDMLLPDMDGHEVLSRLRAHPATADIPCVALSANTAPEDVRRARDAGFVEYWTKPIDIRLFVQGLKRTLS